MSDYHSNFELKLAYHTAPSLYGIKASSLMKVGKSEYQNYLKSKTFSQLEECGIKTRIIHEENESFLIFVYNEELFKKHMRNQSVMQYLQMFGYGSCKTISECFDRLSLRITESASFPHEIGIFLGYPIEDVDGFIKNKGKNFKLCGFWKVYSDEEKAKRTFRTYRQCRKYLCSKISNGAGICEALGSM